MCVSANHPARKINQRDTLAPVLFNNLLCDTHAPGIILPGAAS